MPSSLMPLDSNKKLHLKLLDLLIDATDQYNAMNQLIIPEKIKKKLRQIIIFACKNSLSYLDMNFSLL